MTIKHITKKTIFNALDLYKVKHSYHQSTNRNGQHLFYFRVLTSFKQRTDSKSPHVNFGHGSTLTAQEVKLTIVRSKWARSVSNVETHS